MSYAPTDLCRGRTQEGEADLFRAIIRTCMETLHQSPDMAARAEALKLLQDMGVLQ